MRPSPLSIVRKLATRQRAVLPHPNRSGARAR